MIAQIRTDRTLLPPGAGFQDTDLQLLPPLFALHDVVYADGLVGHSVEQLSTNGDPLQPVGVQVENGLLYVLEVDWRALLLAADLVRGGVQQRFLLSPLLLGALRGQTPGSRLDQ